MPERETLIGTVTQISHKDGTPTGLKLDGRDTWFNYTRPEYRQGVWYEPKRGDMVQIVCSESNGRQWVQAITLVEAQETTPEAQEGAKWTFADKDRLIAKECALKAAVEFYSRNDATPKSVVEAAETFADFLLGEKVDTAVRMPVAVPSPSRNDVPFMADNESSDYRA